MSSVLLRGSIEKAEIYFPVRWKRVELATDTEGPGEFTGCTGTYTEMVQETKEGVPAFVMTGNSDGQRFPPPGVMGGGSGRPAEMYLESTDGERRVLRTMDNVPIYPGEKCITLASGGGGWGDPLNRTVERVRDDVMDLLVSAKRAKDVYGVIIDPGTFDVDQGATEKLRKEKKAMKKNS